MYHRQIQTNYVLASFRRTQQQQPFPDFTQRLHQQNIFMPEHEFQQSERAKASVENSPANKQFAQF